MQALWGEAVRSVEQRVKPTQRDQWLRPIAYLGFDGSCIRLRAPNRYHKEWFEDHYLPAILSDLQGRTKTALSVTFEVAQEETSKVASYEASEKMTTCAPSAPTVWPSGLDSRYDFDSFVVGNTNRFAYAAARMVAEAPASKYSPLFIYGGVGLGKTHLLHAVGQEIHRQHPEWNITVVTCEKFVSSFISSMLNQRRQSGQTSSVTLMEEFRSRYREAPDVLLVDDIQFLSGKDSSQDEFFHTFNALHHSHKQIVLTCDKVPAELPGVEERLRSRFTWGLIAEIGHPDLETRMAILKRKAEVDNIDLPDDVALTVASRFRSNVRELEGALLHLSARASVHGCTITKEVAEESLKSIASSEPGGLTIEAIQREVASYFEVKLHDLKGPKRHQAVAYPRLIAMYLSRQLTRMSYPEIGSRFGGKDHSTVISAVRKIEKKSAEDSSLRSVLSTLTTRLRQR
ncbi:MAG: chromosomal replication initiator protein DnaA [Deltaproteobacteria bacterium]|nr:chromosomal replication initiator protein DnaA [Deltaproteobacteria bacterium]